VDVAKMKIISFWIGIFGIKLEKSPVLTKKFKKNSAAMFLIRYWWAD
jgi:hypothetical protein